MDIERALTFTRYNSGTHFLDSGGDGGRHWQSPADGAEAVITPSDGGGYACDAAISTTALLSDCFDENEDMAAAFEVYCKTHDTDGRTSWVGLIVGFLTSHDDSTVDCDDCGGDGGDCEWCDGSGTMPDPDARLVYESAARDNTYNHENDLTQCLLWEAFMPEHASGEDWIWSSDAVVVVQVHTGADVRGGYSAPMFGRMAGEYSAPAFDLGLEWHAEAAGPSHPDRFAEAEIEADRINESGELSSGYSSNATCHAESLGFDMDGGRWVSGRYLTRGPEAGWYWLTPGRAYMGE